MIEYIPAKTGALTALVDGKALHSRYDPVREADRFLSDAISDIPAILVIIEAGLGYLERVALDRFPRSIIISIGSNAAISRRLPDPHTLDRHKKWTPESAESFSNFLTKHIREEFLLSLEAVEWPAGIDIFGSKLKIEFLAFMRRLKGSFFTLKHFGRRWTLNACVNFLQYGAEFTLPRVQRAVVAASGPSLQHMAPLLRQKRGSYSLIALPSSFKILQEYELIPDLAINIDGGYYSALHFAALPESVPVAAPLIAMRPRANPTIRISLDSYLEIELWKNSAGMALPWSGTVAASALYLALQMADEVILVGQDFCGEDLKDHAKPHTFDAYYESASHRTEPLVQIYQKLFWHGKSSLPFYAEQFTTQKWPTRLKRLAPSSVALPISVISEQDFLNLPSISVPPCGEARSAIAYDERRKRVEALLQIDVNDERRLDELGLYLAPLELTAYRKTYAIGDDSLLAVKKRELSDKLLEELAQLQKRVL